MKAIKVKLPKTYTRAQAEHAIASGEKPPQHFLNMSDPFRIASVKDSSGSHANYHVRAKAWRKMGCPALDNPEEHAKFLSSIKVKVKFEPSAEEAHEEA